MLEFLKTIFSVKPFVPHGHCYLWKTELVGLHVIADTLTALAFYSISIALFYLVRQRKDLPFQWIVLLFEAFLISCGTTHLLESWTLWYPTDWLAGGMKAITAFISVFTAIELIPTLSKVLALPGLAELQPEATLQAQQQFLRQVIDSNPNPIFVKDWDGRFTLANQALAEVYNTTIENIIGKTDADFCPNPRDVEQYAQADRWVMQTLQSLLNLDETFTTAEGTIHYFQSTKTPLMAPDGETRYVLGVANDITTLKQTEAALQQKTEELETFFSSTIDLLCIANAEGYFLRLNPEWQRTLGYSLAELEGKQLLDFVHPEDLESTQTAMAQLSQQQSVPSFINRYRHRNGSYRWIEWRSVLKENRIYAAARDITEHLRIENERKQAEAALRLTDFSFESSSISAAWIKPDASILRVNAAACQTLGYSREELQSMYVYDLDPNFPIELWSEHWRQLKQQKHLSFVTQQRTKTGRLLPVEVTLNYVEFDGEEYNFASMQDISDRLQAEAVLRESEERFRSAFDHSAIGMALIGLDGRWLKANPAVCEIIGYSNEELFSLTFQDLTHPDDLETDLTHVHQLLAGEIRTYQMEKRYFHKQGQIVWGLLTVSLVRNSQDEPLYFISQIQDVTARKQAEEQLRQSENTKRALIQAIPDLLIRMRNDGTQLELINQGCVHFVGTAIAFVGSNVAQVLPTDVAAERLRCAEQALTTGEVQFHEYQLIVEGQLCYEEARVVPLQTNEVLMMVRDISDRKRMEQSLRESETRFRTLIENLQVGVVVHGVQAEILLCNSKALELLGVTESQLLGKTSFDPNWNIIHEDGSPFSDTDHPAVQAIVTGRSVRNVIMGVDRPDPSDDPSCPQGDRVWLLVDAEPRIDEHGNVQQVICTFSDISDRQAALRERERAKAELQQREQEFRALVENAPDIIMRLNYECRYLYINPTVERHSGIPASAFINKTIAEFGAPEALIELWRTKIHKAFETGQEQKLEFEIPTDTGTVYYATRVVPEFANDGSVQSILAIARDISDYVRILQEREQADEQLRQSEERLRLALKAAKFSTWECDFTTGELFQSNISELYGLEPGQTHKTYEDWKAQVHPDDRDWMQAEFDRAIQKAGEFSFEFRIIRPDGTVRWTLSTGTVVHNQTGQPLYSHGIAADITDRKLAEVEQSAQQAFLRQVIDTVPTIIFVKDKVGRILIVNQAGADAHGTTVEAMLGKRETDFNPKFSPEQLEEFLAINQQVMQTRQPCTDLLQSIVTATGETHWYQTVINPLVDVQGQVTGIVGATTDITNLKHVEQALQQAKEAAEAANKAKSIFLANMSHELRTPLNVILGFAQVMQRDPLLPPAQRENLQIIHRSGDHLLSLINDVLDLSKIEAGHMTLDESSIDLIDLLQSLEQMFRQRAALKGLQLHLELTADLPQYVTIDANKLRQVLINLLGNAIKFTQRGTVTLRVNKDDHAASKTEKKKRTSILFEVTDTGVGIDPVELETIFNAFVQTQVGKALPNGTGLGLTISREFVQMMGGNVTVQSVLDQGSTFAFTLPVSLAQSADAAIPSSEGQVIGLAPNQPTYRILVVDDQPENRRLLVKLLTQIGLEVREAANGEEAIAQWQHWQPHLIYMDIRLPLLNGYETTQKIRATPNGQTPIIIALTAQASRGDRALALASGFNDYLTKPFQEKRMFSKMAEHLGLKYLYAREPVNLSDAALPDAAITLHPANLSVMPEDWIAALRQSAQLCDDSSIENLIKQIPVEQATLVEGLRQLVQSYSFKQIIGLTVLGFASNSEKNDSEKNDSENDDSENDDDWKDDTSC